MGRISEVNIQICDHTRNIEYQINDINRKFSIILGDSGTGKTDMINTIQYIKNHVDDTNYNVKIESAHNLNIRFGLNTLSDGVDYLHTINSSKNTVFFIDDSSKLVNDVKFRDAILESSNLAIIMRRKKLVPYQISIDAIFELRTTNNIVTNHLVYNISHRTSKEVLKQNDNSIAITEDSGDGLRIPSIGIVNLTTSNGNYNLKNCINKNVRLVILNREAGGNFIKELIELQNLFDGCFKIISPLCFEYALMISIINNTELHTIFPDTFEKLKNNKCKFDSFLNSIMYSKNCQSAEQYFKDLYSTIVDGEILNADVNKLAKLVEYMYSEIPQSNLLNTIDEFESLITQ